MALYEFEGKRPSVHESAFVHDRAVLIGDVRVGESCFIGAGAVLRGDWGTVIVGAGSNVQENAVLHAGPGTTTELGPSSHIGHGAILHGCVLEEHVLVGMGAIVNDAAFIGEGSFIASGALVPPRTRIPARKMVVGVPGRVVGDVSEQMEQLTWMGTRLYQELPGRYAASLKSLEVGDCRPEE